ncbi:hypothetical protein OC844_007716 [Tilletia horrida]|nr:hypothetical protein OC844_007716 [Tilletia horrida]
MSAAAPSANNVPPGDPPSSPVKANPPPALTPGVTSTPPTAPLFSFAVGPPTPSPSPARKGRKRKQLPEGSIDVVLPSAEELKNKYDRIEAAGVTTALVVIRQQDEIIADLRLTIARLTDSNSAERADRKAILGALDLLAASVSEVKAKANAPPVPGARSGVPSHPGLAPSFASVVAQPPPVRPPPPPSAAGFGRPTPAAVALAAAVSRPRLSPADALRAAVHVPRASAAAAASESRAKLDKDDFDVIHVRNLRRMTPSAVRQTCVAMGVDAKLIHDVGRVGTVTELVVTKDSRDDIAAQLSTVPDGIDPAHGLIIDLNFDASKPIQRDANAEVAEKALQLFNDRMREQQSRCAHFGWKGLADFFAGRVNTAASRRAAKSAAPASTSSSPDAPAPAPAAASDPSSSSMLSSMEGVEVSSTAGPTPAEGAPWLSQGVDIVGVLESWYLNRNLYASDPSFLVASQAPPVSSSSSRRFDDGLLVLASARVRDSIINISRSQFSIQLALPGLSLAFVYAPPRLNDAEFLSILQDLKDCDIVMGDLNVRLEPLFGGSGTGTPFGRYHSLSVWMSCAGLAALPPSTASTSASRWDHVLVRSSLWDSLESCLLISPSAPAGIDTDHPILDLRLPLGLTPDGANPDAGLRRMHLGRLHKAGAWQRLQSAYAAVSPAVEARLALAEQAVLEPLDEPTRQEIVDAADAVLHEAVLAVGFACLGGYDVKVAPRAASTRNVSGANLFAVETALSSPLQRGRRAA